MSKKKLEEFIIQLSEDSELKQSYIENPTAVMQKIGLEKQEIKAIMSGDKRQISAILGQDAELVITGIIHLVKK
ncbi:hypothetical protein [Kangiella koreensis]|uniref:Extradiol ring-cleavage dioxygenase LigAB LigA subunit domain-containing protein n=1 Tax=Kangiella koreensis (strain DSM 16069 / JCM 12317 / KCTC 12182 / SW-125) TaxID=523791 RepID=C7R972_KANKD|nr:hypothetical protein [Kangiella koreensis]ACV27862.1 hypothetical protein Kkor_2453 [Kangiella koreensis DSM 16069]